MVSAWCRYGCTSPGSKPNSNGQFVNCVAWWGSATRIHSDRELASNRTELGRRLMIRCSRIMAFAPNPQEHDTWTMDDMSFRGQCN